MGGWAGGWARRRRGTSSKAAAASAASGATQAHHGTPPPVTRSPGSSGTASPRPASPTWYTAACGTVAYAKSVLDSTRRSRWPAANW